MIDIPADIAIRSVLKSGAVFYFAEETFSSDEPHFFIVLNKNPLGDSVIFMVSTTSKVEERTNWAERAGVSAETLVKVDGSRCSFLTKSSVMNCNDIVRKPLQSLIDKFQNRELGLKGEVSDEVLSEIISGVKKSPLVDEYTKELICD